MMSRSQETQLDQIKKAFGINNWDALLADPNRHNIILSKASPLMLKELQWYEGGKADWTLAYGLLSGNEMYNFAWSNLTQYEIQIAEKLNILIYEYLEFGGWLETSDIWQKRYKRFIAAVSINRLEEDEPTYAWDQAVSKSILLSDLSQNIKLRADAMNVAQGNLPLGDF